jgi:Uma2 family endonuclease
MSTALAQRLEAELLRRRRRVRVAEYHRISESGLLGDEPRRLELIEGVIVARMAGNPPHMTGCDLVQGVLARLVPAGYFVSMAHPVTIEGLDSEPVPDAMVVRGAIRDFAGRRRTPADAAIVVEVSDSSLDFDRTTKSATYAAAGVPVYYLIDLPDRVVEVRSEPRATGDGRAEYARVRRYRPGRRVPLVLDGVTFGHFLAREVLP